MYKKQKIFAEELEYIASPEIKGFAKFVVNRLPDYFFDVPASSTGKYHPAYALGAGGLVRHTKAAILIAHELFNLEQVSFTQSEKDCIIVALMFHDGWKHGDVTRSKYTSFNHPLVAEKHLRELFEEYIKSEHSIADQTCIEVIASAVASHMGQFNTSSRESTVLPKPQTDIQKFVHECDYLASRKKLLIDFENYYNPSDYLVTSELREAIDEFIEFCKKLIANGVDRNLIYQTIADNNDGVKNPNKIKSLQVLKQVQQEVSKLAV